jgi:hypothetical protein
MFLSRLFIAACQTRADRCAFSTLAPLCAWDPETLPFQPRAAARSRAGTQTLARENLFSKFLSPVATQYLLATMSEDHSIPIANRARR